MAEGLKRADLQALAEAKIADAQLLLNANRPGNAYYLAGYSIELGLKACIAVHMERHVIPPKTMIERFYQHDLKALSNLAGLTRELRDKEAADQIFAAHWAIVNQWGPDFRYANADQANAQFLIGAIVNPLHGVLPWIKTFW